MKEITLIIPEKNLEFFMEFVKQLGIEVTDEIEISEEHKAIVRERIRTSKLKIWFLGKKPIPVCHLKINRK
ncbi:hypothetical protein G3O08_02795 [Cryomorpha ignava]|uniref:Uncharacterized protein n=1 Tax=Cryomorpha ignava TaxID=101383 RepID=A0A7K3WLC2_9FLAO|nr:hypothetical protein [Cryomorpha ignava]NEN22429.1 hypothetical protein [Cryomorpha ignava]